MPEHDIFDLDEAFSYLERDVATISSPPGAGQAVSTARRRRRTTFGAAAAVTVLAVGGVAIGQGLGGHDSGLGPSQQPLPSPTPLTAQSFSAATAGWVVGWGQPTDNGPQSATFDAFTCLNDSANGNSPLDEADRTGGAVYVAGETEVGYVIGLEFKGGKSEAAAQAMAASAANCTPAATATTTYTDGSVVTFYELPGKGASGDYQLWTAQYGDRLGLAVIGGAPDAPSSDTVGRVNDLMMGILQVDGTFTSISGGSVTSGSATASSSQFGSISDSDFSAALGTWPNQWERQGTQTDANALPCAGEWTVGSSAGAGSSLGTNGEQDTYTFDTAEDAVSSVDALTGDLHACASSPATISTTQALDGGVVTIGVGSGPSSRVVWIVQRGAEVAYVTIPGDTRPPDRVSQAVAGLIGDALNHVSESPPPAVESSPAQPQQQGDTSTSSSSAAAPQG